MRSLRFVRGQIVPPHSIEDVSISVAGRVITAIGADA